MVQDRPIVTMADQ